MKKPCNSGPSTCCAPAAYWRELANADAARSELLTAECETLHTIIDRLRRALKQRDGQIEQLLKRKKPVASEYGPREVTPVRRRA